MKRLQDFTKNDLAKLRKEIVLNSLYVHDYENSFGICAESVRDFFDGYFENICEIAAEDNFEWSFEKNYRDFLNKYDTIENLYSWLYCFEDFSWVKYEDEEEYREVA